MRSQATILALGCLLMLSGLVLAQSPLGINYQGIARSADGSPLINQKIGLKMSITSGPDGSADYVEEHHVETNEFGLFAVIVGQGQASGSLNDVDWVAGNKWLQIEIDPSDQGGYLLVGTQQMLSVPYALYAAKSGDKLAPGVGIDIRNGQVTNTLPDQPITLTGTGATGVTGTYPNFTINSIDNVDDADADPANEIQTLSKAGNTVSLSKSGGSFTDEVDDADADPANELQELSITGNTLFLSDGGSVDLSDFVNTDGQNLADVLSQGTDANGINITGLADPVGAQDAATKSYVDGQVSILSTDIAANTGLINSETASRISNDGALQTELNTTQTGAGLELNGSYAPSTGTNYLGSATSLKDADNILDGRIEANSSNISSLSSRLDNTYAFSADFIINEPGATVKNQVSLTESLDNFNQIASNEIVIGANGLYLIVIDAQRVNSDVFFNSLYMNINGDDSNIPLFANNLNLGKTVILQLNGGDVIKLLVTTSAGITVPFTGVIAGYKISD